ncbi:MAG: acyl-[acyl-carrier-protein]-phospholipid O-acyltransferase, partial [Rickettsiales bacterium]
GIALGSVMCNKLLKGEINGKLVPYASLGITISIILLFIFGIFYQQNIDSTQIISVADFLFKNIYGFLMSLSLLSLAIFSGFYMVPLYAIMQHRSKAKHLARVIAANNVMNALFMVLASVWSILLFSLNFNVSEVLLIVGILNIPMFFIIKSLLKDG